MTVIVARQSYRLLDVSSRRRQVIVTHSRAPGPWIKGMQRCSSFRPTGDDIPSLPVRSWECRRSLLAMVSNQYCFVVCPSHQILMTDTLNLSSKSA